MRTKVIKSALFLLLTATSVMAAEQTETVAPESSASSVGLEKVVDFQFGGSLCAVCLNAFKGRLMSMTGVKNVEISVDKANPKSGHPPKVAHALIGFDSAQISKASLIETIKRNDFQFLVAKERPAGEAKMSEGLSERYKDERKGEHTNEGQK